MKEYALYPDWVKSVHKIRQINKYSKAPIWVSLLKSNSQTVLDVRLWIDDRPTRCGVFLSHNTALELIDLLDKFLAGEDLTDQDALS